MLLNKVNIILFFFTWLFLLPSFLFAQTEELRNEITKIIKYDTEIEYEDTPGFLIGIIDGDSTFIIDFGHADLEKTTQLSPDDVFELGSLTKPLVASLISILVAEEKISFDDKVNDLLPIKYSNPSLAELTIGQLLNHTSGFPKLPSSFGQKQEDAQNPYSHYSKKELLLYYKEFKPIKRKKKDKSKALYSHLNYGLLEIILELHFQIPFEDMVKENLFLKLGMENSFVNAGLKEVLNPGYDRTLKQVDPWTFPSFAASEGISSSMNDLIRFVRVNLDKSHPVQSALEQTHEMEVATNYNKFLYFGKAWNIVKNKGHYNIISHMGKTSGHQAFAAFIPETQTGVVMLVNSAYGVQDLGLLILRMINYNWKRKATENG